MFEKKWIATLGLTVDDLGENLKKMGRYGTDAWLQVERCGRDPQ